MIVLLSHCFGGGLPLLDEQSYALYIVLYRSGIVQRLSFAIQIAQREPQSPPQLTIKKNGVQDLIQPVDLSQLQDGDLFELPLSENRDDLLLLEEDKIQVTWLGSKAKGAALNPTIISEINLDRVS